MNDKLVDRIHQQVVYLLCSTLPPLLGQRMRLFLYPRGYARQREIDFTIHLPTGSWFAHNTRDYISAGMAGLGYNNWRNIVIANAVLRPGDTCVEVGANIGTETLSYADIVGPTGRVIAFEPLPENLEVLRGQLAFNLIEHVDVHPYALGDTSGTAFFTIAVQETTGGRGYIHTDPEAVVAARKRSITVRIARLDSVKIERPRIRALFIDAEGSESAILRGAQAFLKEQRPIIVLEAVATLLQRAGSSIEELFEIVTLCGYIPHAFTVLGVRPVMRETLPRDSDWLCLPLEARAVLPRIRRLLATAAVVPVIRGISPLKRRAPKRRVS